MLILTDYLLDPETTHLEAFKTRWLSPINEIIHDSLALNLMLRNKPYAVALFDTMCLDWKCARPFDTPIISQVTNRLGMGEDNIRNYLLLTNNSDKLLLMVTRGTDNNRYIQLGYHGDPNVLAMYLDVLNIPFDAMIETPERPNQ